MKMLGECLCHRPCQRDCDRFRIWVLASWNHVENHFHCSAYALDCNALHYRYCVWRLTLKIERTHLIPVHRGEESCGERIPCAAPATAGDICALLRESPAPRSRRLEPDHTGGERAPQYALQRERHAVAHRLENFQCIQYSGSHTIEPRKHQAVNVVEGQSLRGFAPQHVELLSKDKGLGFQRSPRARPMASRKLLRLLSSTPLPSSSENIR